MGNVKATTLTEKFGFKDDDLYRPTHDEIILKLLNKNSFIKLFPNIMGSNDFEVIITCMNHRWDHDDNQRCTTQENKYGRCFFGYSDWEEHLEKGKEYCPVFDDAYKTWELTPKISPESICKLLLKHMKISTEVVVKNKRNYEIGFVDLRISFDTILFSSKFFEIRSRLNNIYFEIKTSIDNFGACMRQLNMYRENDINPLVLITCEEKFNDAFKTQGIKVYVWTGDE